MMTRAESSLMTLLLDFKTDDESARFWLLAGSFLPFDLTSLAAAVEIGCVEAVVDAKASADSVLVRLLLSVAVVADASGFKWCCC